MNMEKGPAGPAPANGPRTRGSGERRDLWKAALFFVAAMAAIVGLKILLGY